MAPLIISEEKQGVFIITLNRLAKKNALNSGMYQQLVELFNYASQTPSIHCLLIQGNDSCFCAGNDLEDFIKSTEAKDLAAFDFINTLAAFDKPLVAAVAGPAVGIGTTLLLHCDMVFAATNSKFKLPFTQLGLSPEAGSSYLLTQRLGQNRAFELLVLGKVFSAEQGLQYGIVNQVCQPEELLLTAQQCAATIAALPLDALMTSRRLIRQATAEILPKVMAAEANEFSRLVQTEDCKSILSQFFK